MTNVLDFEDDPLRTIRSRRFRTFRFPAFIGRGVGNLPAPSAPVPDTSGIAGLRDVFSLGSEDRFDDDDDIDSEDTGAGPDVDRSSINVEDLTDAQLQEALDEVLGGGPGLAARGFAAVGRGLMGLAVPFGSFIGGGFQDAREQGIIDQTFDRELAGNLGPDLEALDPDFETIGSQFSGPGALGEFTGGFETDPVGAEGEESEGGGGDFGGGGVGGSGSTGSDPDDEGEDAGEEESSSEGGSGEDTSDAGDVGGSTGSDPDDEGEDEGEDGGEDEGEDGGDEDSGGSDDGSDDADSGDDDDFHLGGLVVGPDPSRVGEDVRATVQEGEFVLPRATVSRLGGPSRLREVIAGEGGGGPAPVLTNQPPGGPTFNPAPGAGQDSPFTSPAIQGPAANPATTNPNTGLTAPEQAELMAALTPRVTELLGRLFASQGREFPLGPVPGQTVGVPFKAIPQGPALSGLRRVA